MTQACRCGLRDKSDSGPDIVNVGTPSRDIMPRTRPTSVVKFSASMTRYHFRPKCDTVRAPCAVADLEGAEPAQPPHFFGRRTNAVTHGRVS